MAKIKGWEKIRAGMWKNDTNSSTLTMAGGHGMGWFCGLSRRKETLHLGFFRTKSQALTYAKNYMRRHPNG